MAGIKKVMRKKCPTCGVGPGKRCISVNKKRMRKQHLTRRKLADRKKCMGLLGVDCNKLADEGFLCCAEHRQVWRDNYNK